ncbi:hypothetical protein ACIHEJ_37605 [Streptomyces sp. NPDC052301]|uniref:hypothetical protein n=1 Tax=Streptomyces sp. NPDC052301 TaxID=3365687 RepID=UPI0037CDC544
MTGEAKEFLAVVLGQAERRGEQPHRFTGGPGNPAVLEIADCPNAQPRAFGELLLRQPAPLRRARNSASEPPSLDLRRRVHHRASAGKTAGLSSGCSAWSPLWELRTIDTTNPNERNKRMRRSPRTSSRVSRFGAPVVITGMAVIAALTSAQSASALTIHPTGHTCRSETAGSFAPVAFNVSLDSCSLGNGGYGVSPQAGIHNPGGVPIDICAHAVDVNTGNWAYDYGCAGWNSQTSWDWKPKTYHDLPTGTYVISVGFWANNSSGSLSYYGDIQSPRITVTP